MCYEYHDGSAASAGAAVQDLAEYARDSGPFDAVLAFSSGAALAASLMIAEARDSQAGKLASFRSAVFLCATLPRDVDALADGRAGFFSEESAREAIQVPTVHLWGQRDTQFGAQSKSLVQMCSAATRTEIVHEGGHEVPTQGEALEKAVQAIAQMM